MSGERNNPNVDGRGGQDEQHNVIRENQAKHYGLNSDFTPEELQAAQDAVRRNSRAGSYGLREDYTPEERA